MAKTTKPPAAPNSPRSTDVPTKEKNEVSRWMERIRISDRIFKAWERRFQCQSAWDWYEGYQGANAHILGDPTEDRYIINLILPTIDVKIPALYFHNPKATVVPKPSREDDPMSNLQERARLREDTVNTVALDPALHLKEHTNLALKDSFFYFSVIETGYSADYIKNPNAGKPVLDPDGKITEDEDGEPVTQPLTVTVEEGIYVKRIDPSTFRVSARSSFILEECDWCGYFEWVYATDLKRDLLVQHRDKIKATGRFKDDYTGKISLNEDLPDGFIQKEDLPSKIGMVKIWKIWDIRKREFFILPDDGGFYLQPPTKYVVFPFSTMKHNERKEGWLPLPPMFNWLPVQAELNDTRQMQKIHRKRMTRRYQMLKGSVDAEELDKLDTGEDGTIIQTNTGIPAVVPIEDAPLDFSVTRNIPQTKEDFADLTATGSDQRQAQSAQPETATESSIVETRARIRESFAQQGVAKWVGDIFWRILQTIEAHCALPFFIRINVDPLAPNAIPEGMTIAQTYQEIRSEELQPLTYDVSVEAESLSPINSDVERQRFGEFMTILSTNPVLLLMFRTSDALLRKFLGFYGMRNEKTIQQIKLAIEVSLLAQTGGMSQQLPQDPGKSGANAMESAAASGSPSPTPGGPSLPGLPAAVQQIRNQIGLPSS